MYFETKLRNTYILAHMLIIFRRKKKNTQKSHI